MAESIYQGGASVDDVRSRVETDRIYKLSSNENPLGPSPRVVAAITKAAETIHIYPPREDDALRERIADYHGRGLRTDHLFTGNSGSEVIEWINRAFVQAGDEVIVSSPTFGLYRRLALKLDLKLVDVPLDPDTFEYDVAGILNAVTERTRLIYICNPNNPTGTLLLRPDMEALLAAVPDHVLVVVDEVYYPFVDDSRYPDSIQSVLDEQRVVIVHSFSKTYAMAGMRLGYGIAPPDIVKQVRHFRCPFHLNSIALAAGLAALDDREHLERTLAAVREGLRYLTSAFDRLGIRYWPTSTNFVMIKPAAPAEWVEEELLRQGIMVRPTRRNGLPGGLRVTVGLPEANEAFIHALEKVLSRAATATRVP